MTHDEFVVCYDADDDDKIYDKLCGADNDDHGVRDDDDDDVYVNNEDE